MKWHPRLTPAGIDDGPVFYSDADVVAVMDAEIARWMLRHRGGRKKGSVPWNKNATNTKRGRLVLMQSRALLAAGRFEKV
jgi:hypothetical protein